MNKDLLENYSSKVIFALIFVSIVPLTIYLYFNDLTIKNSFSILEKKQIETQMGYANKILDRKLEDIGLIAKDYSAWDDTYNIMLEEDPNIEWIKENITEWIPHNFNMDLLILVRNDLKIIGSYGVEKTATQKIFSIPKFQDVINGKYDNSITLNKGEFPKGIIQYNDKLYMLTITPILRSNYKGTTRGALILGKEISPIMLEGIKENFGYDISVELNNHLVSTSKNKKLVNKFLDISLNNKEKIIEINKNYLIGQKKITDFSGVPNVKLYAFQSRDIFLSTLKLMNDNGTLVIFFNVLLIICLSFSLKDVITTPIISLEKQLRNMEKFNYLKHIDIKGSKEIKSLVHSFNSLVDNINVKEYENKILKKQNNTDELTSLFNHRHFHQMMKDKMNSGLESISLIFLDIDKFKVVNDIHGHVIGDNILKSMGRILKDALPEEANGFRYGGEEFVVLVENYTLEESHLLAEKLRSKIIKSNLLQSQCESFPITVSVGVASYPEHTKRPFELLNMSDRAMYFAKQNGRNQTYIYNEKIEEFLREDNEGFKQKEVLLNSALAFAAAIDAKDNYTGKHSEMVTKYSLLLAEKINMSKEDKHLLRVGALLHDCGKIGIPDSIISKPGKLSIEEYEIIKEHTELGYTILKYVIENAAVMACVRNHHEKWDGSGYPDSLAGKNIHLFARVVTLADSFHAMTSDRPYKNGLSVEEAIGEIRRCSGTQFDPSLTELFIQSIEESQIS